MPEFDFERVRGLTVSQPFASFIASGAKIVENRCWKTTFRGTILIHAGLGTQYRTKRQIAEEGLPTGAIVAVGRLRECVSLSRLRTAYGDNWALDSLTVEQVKMIYRHQHTEGPYCWVLEDVVQLQEPIPFVGRQGLWKPDDETVAQVQAGLRQEVSGG